MRLFGKFSIGVLLLTTPVFGEDVSEMPLPDLNVAKNDLGDARKYVIFHKPGIAAAQAEADLAYCYRFLPHGVSRKAPDFVPWSEPDATVAGGYNGGSNGLLGYVVGLGIVSIIDGPLERSIRQSRLYRCMMPLGYARYRTSEEIWKLLNANNSADGIRVQARIAAGPTPPTEKIEP